MLKILPFVCAFAICTPALADPIPASPSDKPVIKQPDGNVLMWEVPATPAKPKAPSPEEQEKIDQAVYNEASYMQQAAQQNALPPLNDATTLGAVTPPFLPYSTVPGGSYDVSGSVTTPFVNRQYSYGGTSQSFGAPMFYGNEIPNPALAFPTGYPVGGAPLLPLIPQRPAPPDFPGGGSGTVVSPNGTTPSAGGLAVPRPNVLVPDGD